MFENAQNTVISGGSFVHEASEGMFLKLLQEKVAHGAFHDSDERFLAPRCYPHTRDDVLTTITNWIHASGKKERLMWLCGPAKVGKSAIAQTIADRCNDANILMASFFFSRNYAKRSDKSYLIPTIAYQLTVSIPEIRKKVWDVLRNDPLILSRSLEAQAKALIVRPLTEAALGDVDDPDQGSPPRLVILDGIDECKGDEIQIYIVNVLSAVVKELPIPLLFLITSRPEPHLLRTFSTKNMKLSRKLLTIDHCNHSFPSYPASVFSLDTALLQYFPQESSPDHHTFDDSVHISYSSEYFPQEPSADYGTLDDSVHISFSSDNYVNRPSLDVQIPTIPLATDPTWKHLLIRHFGPLATSQIRCILPVLGGRMLLIGHDDGLSVLDLFARLTTDDENFTNGPTGLKQMEYRAIWRGETIFRMSVIETANDHGGTQGVVLVVAGPNSSAIKVKPSKQARVARLYNYSSLLRLAQWAVQTGADSPVDLSYKQDTSDASTPPKRNRVRRSFGFGFRNLMDSLPGITTTNPTLESPPNLNKSNPFQGNMVNSSATTQSFADEDIWKDLPLKWATDFVPLALPGSRLAGVSVIAIATWPEGGNSTEEGIQLLAVATKSAIVLYETPKGSRAFRFVKEFYLPLVPRNIAFVEGSFDDRRNPEMGGVKPSHSSPSTSYAHDNMTRNIKTMDGVPWEFEQLPRGQHPNAVGDIFGSPPVRKQGTRKSPKDIKLDTIVERPSGPASSQESPEHLRRDASEPYLFIIFDKQAGWLRLADSTVGVMTLAAVGGLPPPIEDPKSKWALPVRFELPIPGQMNEKQFVYILTRGFRTHIVSYPSPPSPPLAAVFWNFTPTFVSPRLVRPKDNLPNALPLLQLVAFSSSGIEIQEMGLSFLDNNRASVFPTDIKRTKVFEGEVEFLAVGRHWETPEEKPSLQSSSGPSGEPVSDTDNDTSSQGGSMGIYGWCYHSPSNGRVFWIGGNAWDDWSGQSSSTVR